MESLNTTPAPTAATLESHEIAAFKLPDPVIQVRWLREGGRVMIETGGKIRALWLADVAQPQNPRKLDSVTPPWVHLSISSDGRVAVAACIDKTIWRWDLQTGQSRQLRTERASLTALAVTPDDRRAVYVCRGEIQYCDLMTGDKDDLANRKLRERTGSMIERIWLCSDSNRVVSKHIDHGIRVWDLRKARASRDVSGGAGLAHLNVFPDGHRLLTSSSDGVIAIDGFRQRHEARDRAAQGRGRRVHLRRWPSRFVRGARRCALPGSADYERIETHRTRPDGQSRRIIL